MELANGRYVLDGVLGTGGSATVYRATDTSLGVQRAVKLLRAGSSSREVLRERLKREAQAMAQLDHKHILRIYDVGVEADDDFVVMELAEGGSLGDVIDAMGPISPKLAIEMMVQVLSALRAAHKAGIVHRDVKPQNVLLDQQGVARLADFGIARFEADEHGRTRTGVAMGSLAFMAPEQRLDARSVGPAADIYAAGTTLFNLLTAANPVDLFAARRGSPRWEGIPEPLAAVVRRATQYEPEARYATASAMAHDLAALLETASDVPLMPGAGYELPVATTDLRTGVTAVPAPPRGVVRDAITFLEQDARLEQAPDGDGYVPTAAAVPAEVDTPLPAAPVWVPTEDSPAVPQERRRGWVVPLLVVLLLLLTAGGLSVGLLSNGAQRPAHLAPEGGTTEVQPLEPSEEAAEHPSPADASPEQAGASTDGTSPVVPGGDAEDGAPDDVASDAESEAGTGEVAEVAEPTPAEPTAAAAPKGWPVGRFKGSGSPGTIELQLRYVEGGVSGELIDRFGTETSRQVRGTFSDERHILQLEDVDSDAPDAMKYRLEYDDGRGVLKGRGQGVHTPGVRMIVLRRAD